MHSKDVTLAVMMMMITMIIITIYIIILCLKLNADAEFVFDDVEPHQGRLFGLPLKSKPRIHDPIQIIYE